MGVTVDPEKREKNEKNDTIIEDEDDEENSMISAVRMNYKFILILVINIFFFF
jgi:hypothetical protein